MTILRFVNPGGHLSPTIAVTILGPCDVEPCHFRFMMPNGQIGCASVEEFDDIDGLRPLGLGPDWQASLVAAAVLDGLATAIERGDFDEKVSKQ